jgi:nucleoside-diphosphate kinase
MSKSLFLIKPDAFAAKNVGAILNILEQNSFEFKQLKLLKLDRKTAEQFYEMHVGKPFFDDLLGFMTSGSIVAVHVEKENAVENLRKTIGNTNPELAEPNTIRSLYGKALNRNAVHASDSDENAEREIKIIFG